MFVLNNIKKLEEFLKSKAAVFKVLPAKDVVLEKRIRIKCDFGCKHAGTNYSCPPYVPSVDEFKEILAEYDSVAIIVYTINSDKEKSGNSVSDAMQLWEEQENIVFERLLAIEKEALRLGFVAALGLRPGSCNLCSPCRYPGNCIFPDKRRFTPESVGINLMATIEKVGLELNFDNDQEGFKHVVMMLLN